MTVGKLCASHGLIVATRHPANDLILWLGGLHNDHTLILSATRTTCHLRHQRKGTFRGAEVGRKEQIIGIENTHHSHTTEVEALGDHLRADKDVGLPRLEGMDDTVVGTLRGDRIAVKTCHTGIGKERRYSLLDTLRTKAHRFQIDRLALRTGLRHSGRIAAVVTLHAPRRAVLGKGYIAIGTAWCPATAATLHKGCEAATILEEHRLLTTRESIGDGVYQDLVKVRAALTAFKRTHRIGDDDVRCCSSAITLRKQRVAILAPLGIGITLERGGGTA